MSSTIKKIMLKSNDGKIFEVGRDVISQSTTLDNMFKELDLDNEQNDESAEETIPLILNNVNGATMQKVITWCQHQKEKDADSKRDLWEVEFMRNLSQNQGNLFELILAANYLDMAELMDVACKGVADMIKGKTVEEIRQAFSIRNDFASPEEEEKIRKEQEWCKDQF